MRRFLNVGLLLVVLHTNIATAAEVRVLSVTATGLMALLEQLAPEYERTTRFVGLNAPLQVRRQVESRDDAVRAGQRLECGALLERVR